MSLRAQAGAKDIDGLVSTLARHCAALYPLLGVASLGRASALEGDGTAASKASDVLASAALKEGHELTADASLAHRPFNVREVTVAI